MGAVQKRLVGLGISTIVVGGIAAFAYFGTYKGKKADEEKKQVEEKLAAFKLADVKEVELQAKGETFVVVGDGEGENKWRLTKPLATGADKATIEQLINHFADLKRKRGIDRKPEDMKAFGLEPPQFTVVFRTADGKSVTYLIGKKNSFDDNVYVSRDGDAQVSMVPNAIVYQVDRDLFALREKRALIFEDKEARKIEVEIAGKPAYTLEKRGDDWHVTQPIEAKADKAQATTVLSTLRYLRAKAIVAEEVPAQDTFGLAKPEAAATLTLGDAGKKLRIVFATLKAKTGGETTYAHVDGQKQVIELGESPLKKLDLKPSDLRDKQILTFNREDIKKVKLAETGKDFVVFEKKDQQWEIVAPEQKPAQDSKITNMIYKLSTLKAKTIVAETATDELKKKFGLDPVTKQITLYKGDGSEAGTLLIGVTEGELTHVFVQGGTRIDGADKTQLADLSFDAKDYVKAETASTH